MLLTSHSRSPLPSSKEPEQVARDTSLPPPPLVRPDRQIVYEGGPLGVATGRELHDHDTITVDRIRNDIDGPSHRFLIRRGDTVEAWFATNNLQVGTVVGISHARREVAVRLGASENGIWFAVGAIYPVAEGEDSPQEQPVSSVRVEQPEPLPAPEVTDKRLLTFLSQHPGKEFTPSELRQELGCTTFDAGDPLKNPVHQALKSLRDRGRLHVQEQRFGEPRFSVLAFPDSPSELTVGHCPASLAGPEVRYLFTKHGQTIAAFAKRWGFTQKHVREVFDRGLDNPHAVRDWLEAMLTPAEQAATPEAEQRTYRARSHLALFVR